MKDNIEQFKPFPLNPAWMIGNYSSIKRPNGEYAKQSLHSVGYLALRIPINGVWKSLKAHQVIAITWIPNPLNKRTVNHDDLNKTNNDVSNLSWMTMAEQIQHARKAGAWKNCKPRTGFTHSNETKRKMSDAKKGRHREGSIGNWGKWVD